jgi:hypothetical protein
MDSKVFKKYKFDATVFFETGTYLGNAILEAAVAGFDEFYSIEFHPPFYEETKERFKNNDKVHLYQGSSDKVIAEVLPTIEKRCLFWLDAHDTFHVTDGSLPTFGELDIIKEHPIKNHTIIIDDTPVFFGDGVELNKKLLEINPDYTIERIPNATVEDYITVAYIKE